MQDEQILELFWNRDESAITETETKYGKKLTKIAHNILGNQSDVEECVNDTYLAAWNSIPPQKPHFLFAYLSKIARGLSVDMLRRKNRQKRRETEYSLSLDELAEVMSGGNTPDEELEKQRLGKLISSFLRTLSEDERNTFIGRYYYMDPLKEVASYCDMSEGKAKSMLYRTRCKLKKFLLSEGYEI